MQLGRGKRFRDVLAPRSTDYLPSSTPFSRVTFHEIIYQDMISCVYTQSMSQERILCFWNEKNKQKVSGYLSSEMKNAFN